MDVTIVVVMGLVAPVQKRVRQVPISRRYHGGVRERERLPCQADEQRDQGKETSHLAILLG